MTPTLVFQTHNVRSAKRSLNFITDLSAKVQAQAVSNRYLGDLTSRSAFVERLQWAVNNNIVPLNEWHRQLRSGKLMATIATHVTSGFSELVRQF